MATPSTSKHAARSAQTRERFIHTAQQLFAERGVDAVSLNEITVAAGQKNRNALQYHFGSRHGLVQAILDYHADDVARLREQYQHRTDLTAWTPAEAAARVLVMPLGLYLQQNPEAHYYVRIQSQLAALNSPQTNPGAESPLSFRKVPGLETLLAQAMSHLSPGEQRRRLFLVVSINFHSMADICRAFDDSKSRERSAMLDQLVCAISALLESPARG